MLSSYDPIFVAPTDKFPAPVKWFAVRTDEFRIRVRQA